MEIIKKMNWENLRVGKCPYCGETLMEEEKVRCTKCHFHIDRARVISMIDNMIAKAAPGYVKKKWQNLHENKCPVCSFSLTPTLEFKNHLRCSNGDCLFHIDKDRVKEILNDPYHNANRFKKVSINPFTYEPEPTKKRYSMRSM
jgi:hypothetical protein